MQNKYDAIIIGAGMSGLAAGIRLAMFDKKVLILEKHIITGGLNSYYERRVKETKELLEFDVGLHALTNFATKGERGKPLTKLLKQLRIPYDDLCLRPQTYSLIKFNSEKVKFSNDLELLQSEIAKKFPAEIDSFLKFLDFVKNYNEVDLNAKYIPSREMLKEYFKSELLQEMILAPLLIYGSAWERDMDFSQFVIMFKSLYLEGFSRPEGGVRRILNLLEEKYKSLGGELEFRREVVSITPGKEIKIELKRGETLFADKVFSSVGLPETDGLLKETALDPKPEVGRMSFMETIIVTKDKTPLSDYDPTIVFYNESDTYAYQKPTEAYDMSSAVFCLPDNYEKENKEGHAVLRTTFMANFDIWSKMEKPAYRELKEKVYHSALDLNEKILGKKLDVIYRDVFSPTTIKKYTGHFNGTVYGSTTKLRNGESGIENLYIIGTDQGFLGIVGAMLSGISMANLHGLMK